MTVSVSRPERSTVPGMAPVASPSRTVSTPLTNTWCTPVDPAVRRTAPPGRSSTSRAGSAPTVSGIEDHEVGPRPDGDPPSVAQAEQARRLAGERVDRLLERHEPPAAQAVRQELGRVRTAAHAIEVRAGVGPGEQHVVVVPHPGPQRPGLVVVARRRRPQHGPQLVGEHDVDEGVERIGSALARDVTHEPARRARRWRALWVSPIR